MKILKRPLISKGKFYFSKPDSLRWEYTSPIESILLAHKGQIRSFIKGKHGIQEDSRSKAQAMQIVMKEIASWLKGNFHKNQSFSRISI